MSDDDLSYTSIGDATFSVYGWAGTKYQIDLASLTTSLTTRFVKLSVTGSPDVRMLGGSWVHVSEVRVE